MQPPTWPPPQQLQLATLPYSIFAPFGTRGMASMRPGQDNFRRGPLGLTSDANQSHLSPRYVFSGKGRGGRGRSDSGSDSSQDGDRGRRFGSFGGRGQAPAWRSRLVSSKWVRRDAQVSQFFCNVCNKDCKRRERYDEHIAEMHIQCMEPGCTYSAPEHIMVIHRFKHTKAADGTNVVDSPEEHLKWLAARRACFPSKGNLKRKADCDARRYQMGALTEDRPKPGLLETLIRRTALMDAGGKGWGKEKGKGKWDKGKGKGKDKGYDKGKGKNKGWSNSWDRQGDCGAPERPEHVLATLPLASMVANCVPLEAPFGQMSTAQPQQRRWTRGICRFYEKGFCYHGDRCQYEHTGVLALTDGTSTVAATGEVLGDASRLGTAVSSVGGPPEKWWALPSTLANRACPGPQPPPNPRASGFGRMRPTFVRPARELQERMRRDGLLRRMMRPEVDGFYSAVLQCVRYVVDTDFLRRERALRPVPLSLSDAATLAANGGAALTDAIKDLEDLDQADPAELAAMALDDL